MLPLLLAEDTATLTEERLSSLLSESAGRGHSHLGPYCDPVVTAVRRAPYCRCLPEVPRGVACAGA